MAECLHTKVDDTPCKGALSPFHFYSYDLGCVCQEHRGHLNAWLEADRERVSSLQGQERLQNRPRRRRKRK